MGRSRLRIRRTETKGRGVFADSGIPKGSVVVRYRGKPRWIWDIPERLWEHCFQVGYDRYLVPSKGSRGWFVNHSCDPNCGIVGERTIVALRDVRSGEELTFDYSTNVGWPGFSMHCGCRARNCRKTIRSYWNLDDATRKKYGRNVSSYLLKGRPLLERATIPHASKMLGRRPVPESQRGELGGARWPTASASSEAP